MVNNSTPYIHSKWYIIYSRPILDFFQLQILWTWPFCTCSKRRILFLLSYGKTESQIHYSTKEYKVFCKTENIRSIKWPLKSTQLFYQFLKSGGWSKRGNSDIQQALSKASIHMIKRISFFLHVHIFIYQYLYT